MVAFILVTMKDETGVLMSGLQLLRGVTGERLARNTTTTTILQRSILAEDNPQADDEKFSRVSSAYWYRSPTSVSTALTPGINET
jgi:hypothetical protein